MALSIFTSGTVESSFNIYLVIARTKYFIRPYFTIDITIFWLFSGRYTTFLRCTSSKHVFKKYFNLLYVKFQVKPVRTYIWIMYTCCSAIRKLTGFSFYQSMTDIQSKFSHIVFSFVYSTWLHVTLIVYRAFISAHCARILPRKPLIETIERQSDKTLIQAAFAANMQPYC